ncbi:MAG TPA: hypothetical protein VHA37_05540 [Candidatus Saccharimonadales bacterium]|nr:hypothetical protein [Candidatus Saccharimonadales bacterium]
MTLPIALDSIADFSTTRVLLINGKTESSVLASVLFATAGANFAGPASSIDGNFVAFDGTTGKKGKDSGKSAASFATAAQGVKADGATQATDLASNSAGKGASLVGIEDSGDIIAGTTVEGALAELAARLKITQGTTKALSGTTVDITDVPTGVKKIELFISGMSSSAADVPGIRLGTSGGIVSSGYKGSNSTHGNSGSQTFSNTWSTGLYLWGGNNSASDNFHGLATLFQIAANTWVISSNLGNENGYSGQGGGVIALSGALTTIEFMFSGSASYDAGTVVPVYYS